MRAGAVAAFVGALVASACDPRADLPRGGQALRDAQARVRSEGQMWLEALEAFRRDQGRYPSGREGLEILVIPPDPEVWPDWHGPYGEVDRSFLRDPWRRPYHLESGAQRIAVVSEGPDRRYRTTDDIAVWAQVDYSSPRPE